MLAGGMLAGGMLAGGALIVALAGCSPIESYRSFTGVSLNDPDPATALFTQNLMAGEAMEYPNLATVPPPPTRAITTAERQKLTETLVANRTETEASVTAAPPPRPSALASGAPASGAVASAKARDLAPCKTPIAASSNPAAPPPHAPESHQRKRGDPPEPQPQESSLQMPEVRGVPDPEMPCASLPPPSIPPPPSLAGAPVAPPAETVVAGMPAPPPPVPVIADVPPPPNPGRPPLPKRPAAAMPVAAIELPGTPPRIEAEARVQIERVAALYQAEPRTVRVVAYAAPGAPGSPGGEPLAGYHAALERAQAVAAALRAAGIPADKVQAEAAPASAAGPTDRVEIQLMP
jgi:hypothetical protein